MKVKTTKTIFRVIVLFACITAALFGCTGKENNPPANDDESRSNLLNSEEWSGFVDEEWPDLDNEKIAFDFAYRYSLRRNYRLTNKKESIFDATTDKYTFVSGEMFGEDKTVIVGIKNAIVFSIDIGDGVGEVPVTLYTYNETLALSYAVERFVIIHSPLFTVREILFDAQSDKYTVLIDDENGETKTMVIGVKETRVFSADLDDGRGEVSVGKR